MNKNKGIRADILLIGALLIAGGIIAVILLFAGKAGSSVVVRVDGKTVKEFSLSENTEYLIEGAEGGSNVLHIEGGQAWISEADCPDGLCKNMGKINKAGQSIVCLPHKVVVEISGTAGTAEPEVDVYVK